MKIYITKKEAETMWGAIFDRLEGAIAVNDKQEIKRLKAIQNKLKKEFGDK